MDWSGSYTLRLRLYEVNPDTWAECGEVPSVTNASIDIATDKDVLETAMVDAKTDIGVDLVDKYYRLVAETTQNDSVSRTDLATLFCVSAPWTNESGIRKVNMSLSSVLYPASKATVQDGLFIPAGSDAVEWCADLLSSYVKAPVQRRGSFYLNSHIVFGGGAKVLSVISEVLKIGGFRIRIDGNGTITLCSMSDEPSVVITAAGRAFMHDGIKATDNRADIPNRVIAVADGVKVVVTNDRKDSITSTARRGYVYDHYESSPKLIDGETLAAFAERKLAELSVLCEERTYKRDYIDGVFAGDLILAGLQQVDVDGSMRSVRQSVSCSGRIVVQETARSEESVWS